MFGSQFIELFMRHPDVELFAICDLREDRLEYYAKKYGISEKYKSLEDICRSDIRGFSYLHATLAPCPPSNLGHEVP